MSESGAGWWVGHQHSAVLDLGRPPVPLGDPVETLVRVEALGGLGALRAGGGCGWQVGFSISEDAIIGACASVFRLHLCTSVYFPGGGPCSQSRPSS